MINNKERIGNFTSSEIYRLMTSDRSGKGFGKPALEYIKEKNMERRLGRSISTEVDSRPTTWGKFLEPRVFELMHESYDYNSDKTIVHPDFPYWAGSCDGVKFDKEKTVYDIKCPSSLKSFCGLVDPLYTNPENAIEAIRENHTDGDKYFWQLVSNAVLTDATYAELIVYVPYQSELNDVRDMAYNHDSITNKLLWIYQSEDTDLPFIRDNGFYKNLNVVRFEVKPEFKMQLTDRVIEASKLLVANVYAETH